MRSSLRTSVRTSVRTNQFGHRLTESRAQWIRRLRSKLNDGTIDPLLWGMHFRLTETYVQCRDCADFEIGVCKGGQDPIECFEDSTRISKESGRPSVFMSEGLQELLTFRNEYIEAIRRFPGWGDSPVDSFGPTHNGKNLPVRRRRRGPR